ncbi:AMP-binding protein [Kribbella sp. NPDC050820]|uniref:AMP-binding protein n=1 Tax=Kribbella sp. NPDC050820 TaxID=3155408 RepID=UPI0033F809F4
MVALLNELVRLHGTEEAVADRRRSCTWRELDERVNRWVAALRGAGLRPREVVAVVCNNRIECLEVLLACLHSGLVLVPVNSRLAPAEVAHILRDSGCRVVLSEPACDDATAAAALGLEITHLSLEQDLAMLDPAAPGDQTCGGLMLYTSGTTGTPRGVMSHLFTLGAPMDAAARALRAARYIVGIPARRRGLLVCPWYHSAPLYFGLMSLLLGNRTRILDKFDSAAFLEIVAAESIDHCHLVPTHFVRLLRDRRPGTYIGGLETVWHGGGFCDPEVKTEMIAWWGPVLVEYYGATEGGIATMIDSARWERHRGSVGRPLPGTTVTVVGPDGGPVPPGESGRVFVERPTHEGFAYHRDPDKTRAAHLRAGVYTFGELGRVDADGYLYLDGRADDLIVCGGVNIYPAEVTAALRRHPAVLDAVVFGYQDAEFGQVAAALVMAENLIDEDLLVADLRRHCARLVAGFKVPRWWWFTRQFPRDEAGKVRLDSVRQLVRAIPGHASP